MITIKELAGEWILESFVIEKTDGTKKSWGKNLNGILIYTLSAYMSVSINNVEKDKNNILFYAGKFEIADNGNIIHHVMNASDQKKIGKNLTREPKLNKNKLELIGKGDFGVATLIWKKAY